MSVDENLENIEECLCYVTICSTKRDSVSNIIIKKINPT
ncbi:unnamed protein product [Callosobruchus maculatus]|uniref:Uncharacterized protein n=1 Tax=Callosobruchus maculatus TaxID=64391 RepID=A0A653D2N3_CALMS|nr:unnamed protein product [Callosobruchus maculatus]